MVDEAANDTLEGVLVVSSLDEKLVRQKWYLGDEVTTEAASSILNASKATNCFGVYKSDKGYMLSAKYTVGDIDDSIVDHLIIESSNDNKYKLPGQAHSYDDIVEAIEQFIIGFESPLVPALQGTSFEAQISITDPPPEYESVNRVLKPDIAPLPDIATVNVDSVTEAKMGRISPSHSQLPSLFTVRRDHNAEPPQWHHYEELHPYHPKNICYGCCYRRRRWTGYRYVPAHRWYNCRGVGPLRLIGIVLFWLLCGVCFCCFRCCRFSCTLCFYIIFGFDSS